MAKYVVMAIASGRRRFLIALLIIGVAAIVFADVRQALHKKGARPSQEELKAAFPDATRLVERSDPYHHWLAFAGGTEPIGAVFLTTEVPPDVRGYVGPVPVLVGMDRRGVIARLIVLENRETPYYARMIERSGFFKKFAGKSVTENWQDVDAVSGATITSKAIVKDVSTAAAVMAKRLFGVEPAPPVVATRESPLPILFLAISFALGLAAWLRREHKWLRWASWAAGIAVVGLYLDIPLSFSHITSVLHGDLPPWSNTRVVMLIAFAGLTTVIWGPMFCGNICPFGALQEFAWLITPQKLKVTGTLLARLGLMRWVVLFILIILVFPAGISEASGFEPYPYFFDELHRLILGGTSSHTGRLRLAIWVYALVVMVMSAGVKRFWCRLFCPTGSCLLLLSRHRKKGRALSGIEI